MRSRKAQANIIVTVLIILVAIVAVAAVSYFVIDALKKGVDDVDPVELDMRIESATYNDDAHTLFVLVDRGVGGSELAGIRFIVTYSDGTSESFHNQNLNQMPRENEKRSFYMGVDTDKTPVKVEIAPYIAAEDESELLEVYASKSVEGTDRGEGGDDNMAVTITYTSGGSSSGSGSDDGGDDAPGGEGVVPPDDGGLATTHPCYGQIGNQITIDGDKAFCDSKGNIWSNTISTIHSWADAPAACEGLDYAGYASWELPNENEYNLNFWEGACDEVIGCPEVVVWDTGMPPNPENFWWTTEERDDNGLTFGAGYGYAIGTNKNTQYYVRCIKSSFPCDGYSDQEIRYNGDAIFCDAHDKMWSNTISTVHSWADAPAACEGLDYAGYDDWVLPDENEYNLNFWEGACDEVIGCPEVVVWDTGMPPNPENFWWTTEERDDNGLTFGAGYGYAIGTNKNTQYYVRCIRNI